MWEVETTKKEKGYRFFRINNPVLLTALRTPDTLAKVGEIDDDGLFRVHHKLEKEAKNLLKVETIKVLSEDAKKTLSNIYTVEDKSPQGEDSWKFARLQGIATGSDTPFTVEGKKIPTFTDYCNRKAVELYYHSFATNEEMVSIDWSDNPMKWNEYKSVPMMRGSELESEAVKEWLSVNPEWFHEDKGLIYSVELGAGVSLDLLVTHMVTFKQKILEIKSPSLQTFLGYLMNIHRAKQRYNTQVQLQMMVSGVHQAELVIYYPGQRLIRINYTLDMAFAINALLTLKEFKERVGYGINALLSNSKG